MHRYIEVAHSMLQNNFTGLVPKPGDVFDGDGWGAARAHESKSSAIYLPLRYSRRLDPSLWIEIVFEKLSTL